MMSIRSLETFPASASQTSGSSPRAWAKATILASDGGAYFLEQHQKDLGVHEATLKTIEGLRPQGRHYLDRSAGGRLAKRWNLIVPDSIWERRWEEPGVVDSSLFC
jgi:hypothetical protein